jgi:hypothetical protein
MEDLQQKVDNIKSTTENLTEHVTGYIETYIKLAGVNATQQATGVATISLTALMLSFFCLCVVIFSGVGMSVWIGEMLHNLKVGYFIVAGFFLLCAGLFLMLRKKFIFPMLRDHIIRKVYE